ncbi:MAG: peptide chain release factor 1 [Candidatus Omnitrophota bacterium]
MSSLFDQCQIKEKRYQDLEHLLSQPETMADQSQYQKLAKEFSDLSGLVRSFRIYKKWQSQIKETKKMLEEKHDKDFEQLALAELKDLEEKVNDLEAALNDYLNPKLQEKDMDLIIEIRAGTGGVEAGLFAADLYRMYSKFAAQQGWKLEPISISTNEGNGIKEVIFSLSGKGASQRLRWESGVHRVQRVPTTEASGRIHTSAATVAVLFEPEEVELNIDPKELKIDVFRSSGPGGQSVNTTDSAIRITHLPTGMVVICQDERSQLKNKTKAMRVLRARLLDKMKQDNLDKTSQERKAMVGSGDRSEKIRTYNFPDRRITDHRINFTTHQLMKVLDGDLNEITDALSQAQREAEAKASHERK